MAAIVESAAEQLDNSQPEGLVASIDLYDVEELFGDIAEIINENFILEVEASRKLAE